MPDPAPSVVADARLTPDAVRLILDVLFRGPGDHEIPHTHFQILLNHQGGDKRVARALRLATDLGWLERTPGGRGRSDLYRFRSVEFGGGKTLPSANSGGLKPLSPTEFGGAKSPVVVAVEKRVLEEEKSAREEETEIHPAVDALIEEHLVGARDSVRDYLRARVPNLHQQRGYVQTLRTWLDGMDDGHFKKPDGGKVPGSERARWIGAGLNALLASDEAKMKRPVGDVANLRTKIRILVLQDADPPRRPPPEAPSGRVVQAEDRTREMLERQQEDAERAEADMAALWEWFGEQTAELREAVEGEAKRRCRGVPPAMRQAIRIGVIQEHRKGATSPTESAVSNMADAKGVAC